VFTDVAENSLPVQWILEVAHGTLGRTLGVLLVRKDDGGRNSNAQLGSERVVEELVISRPPEGIVDDDGTVKGSVLQKGAIEGDVVRDAVDDDGVVCGLVEVNGAGLNEFGGNAVDIAGIDVLHERARKAVFHSEQNADLFHAGPPDNPGNSRRTLQPGLPSTVYGRLWPRRRHFERGGAILAAHLDDARLFCISNIK